MTNTTPDTNIKYLSEEGLAVLAKLYPEMPAAERELFARQCDRTQLDPLARQIYAVLRNGKWSFQTSIDGFRVIAQRTGEYEGQAGPFWCGLDGQWTDAWTASESPVLAKVGIFRRGFREPIVSTARYDGYVAYDKYGKVTSIWTKMPELMTAKCAEALGLRRAFPQELSGLYTSEEMEQADNPAAARVPATPAGPDLEKQLAASVAANAATKAALAPKPAPPAEPVTDPIAADEKKDEIPSIPQDYDIAKMRAEIEECDTPEKMTAVLPKVMGLTDVIVKTAVQAIFKKHRESKGWKTARNSQGVAGVVA